MPPWREPKPRNPMVPSSQTGRRASLRCQSVIRRVPSRVVQLLARSVASTSGAGRKRSVFAIGEHGARSAALPDVAVEGPSWLEGALHRSPQIQAFLRSHIFTAWVRNT
jgi:hypothetical protein